MALTIGANNISKLNINGADVEKVILNGATVWKKSASPCLTLKSTSPFTISWDGTPPWDGTVEYSLDNSTWVTYYGSTITSALIDENYYIYMRGINNTVVGSQNTLTHMNITGSNVECLGNLETLLDYTKVAQGEQPTFGVAAFGFLFYMCEAIITAPELPSRNLNEKCYIGLFSNCRNLNMAPELPATTLATGCYSSMFYLCERLTTPPALPATTLANTCYASMFRSCANLEKIPALPATTLKQGCYNLMFNGSAKIKMSSTQTGAYVNEFRIPTTGTGTSATNATQGMFDSTGGTYTGNPSVNTSYYTSNDIVYPS